MARRLRARPVIPRSGEAGDELQPPAGGNLVAGGVDVGAGKIPADGPINSIRRAAKSE